MEYSGQRERVRKYGVLVVKLRIIAIWELIYWSAIEQSNSHPISYLIQR